MSEAKYKEGVKEDSAEVPVKELVEEGGSEKLDEEQVCQRSDGPPEAEGPPPELEPAAVTSYRIGVFGSGYKENSSEQVEAEKEEYAPGFNERLNEQVDNMKGDESGEFNENLGKQVYSDSGDDVGELNENFGVQVKTDNEEDADESKENLGGEAISEDGEDALEFKGSLSEQVKEDNVEHDGEATENVDENAKIKTEEEIVKNMDIDDVKTVQPKEDCHTELPLAEDIINAEHPAKANGSTKSLTFDPNSLDGDDSGTEEEQAAFMKELENFFKERSLEFKPPKFYGEGLNCLKLWRAVIRLGGYDQVTSCKLWRQVGESFKPPKTCTTVSWSFRIFYEKALLDYERHKVQTGELEVASAPLSVPAGAENQVGGNQVIGSGRARRDAAARAMQGWHSQGLVGSGEEKSSVTLPKREKQLKTLSVPKRRKPSSEEQAVKVAHTKVDDSRDGQASSPVLKTEITIADVGPVAEWVKVNVRRNKDCFEVYALVPGLLREEVRVQSDPAGRLVISGEPEQPDNPWGVTPFKKVINLPSRINPHQTSAVVTLHGQLFVRAPFEQSSL